LEEASMLKTKAMREREQERYANRYKYSLIRIRFPYGLYLQVSSVECLLLLRPVIFSSSSSYEQGTFGVHEKLANVFDFVMSALTHETAEFSLISPDGVKFSSDDAEQTLATLR